MQLMPYNDAHHAMLFCDIRVLNERIKIIIQNVPQFQKLDPNAIKTQNFYTCYRPQRRWK